MDNHIRNLDYVKNKIEATRLELNKLISKKEGNLLDSEVIDLSQLLDQLLIEFECMNK